MLRENGNLLKKMYDKLIASYVPCQKANCESHKKNVNKEVLRTIRRKHRLWQRFVETKDGQKYELYKKTRNKVKSMLRSCHRKLIKQFKLEQIPKNFGPL